MLKLNYHQLQAYPVARERENIDERSVAAQASNPLFVTITSIK